MNEEAIKMLTNIKAYLTAGNPIWDTDKVAEAIDMAIEALKQNQWILCSERLPSEDGDYLVTFSLMGVKFPIEVCAFEDGKWDKYLYDGVLAWMPLPKAYEGRIE